jgi:superfamily II DNA or RNA helicase
MPTGSGKTRTAMNIVARHLVSHEPKFAIWLAQSSELLEQAAQEFIRAWHHLGNRALPVHRFWGPYAPALETVQDGVLVCGFAKLYAALKRDPNLILRLGDHASLVVVDEAHQSVATTYREMIDSLQLKRPANKLIGLSATPGRTWNDVAADAELAQFYGSEKLTIEVPGCDDPVSYLVEEGYLARAHFNRLVSEGKGDMRRFDEADGDISDEALQRLGEDEDRNIQILRAVEDLFTRHSRVILFAASVAHAKLISALLGLRGYDSSVITATTDPFTREALIRRFKNEDQTKRIICNFGVLTTGFDAPKTSAALIARPTKSLVLFSQMVGRAIRGPKAGGNATCEIMTIVDPTLPGFGSVAEAFANWEDVWT